MKRNNEKTVSGDTTRGGNKNVVYYKHFAAEFDKITECAKRYRKGVDEGYTSDRFRHYMACGHHRSDEIKKGLPAIP
jgi:hypothetical protein